MVRVMTRNESGFTLIEIIAALVLVGILATGGTYALSKAVETYMMTKVNSAMAQKTQAAINRMIIDFTYIDTAATAVKASSTTSLTYVGDFPTYPQGIGGGVESDEITLSQTDDTILYDGDVLLDNVKANTLAFVYVDSAGNSETSFASDTVLVKVSFTIKIANDYEQPYSMQAVVGKVANVGS